jgi:4-diphosphocytidyl-2-C-methyl-D-erythritol kinase
MKSIKVRVNAKINLSLNITGKRLDGYHILESVMASIDITDAVTVVKRQDKNIYLSCYNLSASYKNTAVQAVKALIEEFNVNGADINLTKYIPLSAGLGGSSADAAAALAAMRELYNITETERFNKVASSIGSDVLYMLSGGYKVVGGAGEVVEDINSDAKIYMVIAKPRFGVSSFQCYEAFDADPDFSGGGDIKNVIRGLEGNDLGLIARNVYNSLERTAGKLLPDITEVRRLLERQKPLSVCMSGSGSAVVALCADKEHADRIAENIKDKVYYASVASTEKNGLNFV